MMAVSRETLWNSGHDESVEVNQRALIDKVLARYSGEFTVFRELLQNSDDASSSAVELHFETRAHLDRKKEGKSDSRDGVPNLKSEHVAQWTFKNNGIIFRDEDWSRLKKIAEGNPDEEKIGAFGVGFYSLFSVTEEPFVTSGDQWMGFYWKDKKDQLFARRGSLPESSNPEERKSTSFEMALREPAPMPVAFDLTRFLASSITFMAHVREVSVLFDGLPLVRLSKDPGSPNVVIIPRGLRISSPSKMMFVKAISSRPLYIEADVARCVYATGAPKRQSITEAVRNLKPAAASVTSGFFSFLFSPSPAPTPEPAPKPVEDPPPKNSLELNKSSVMLNIFSADVDVRLDKKMIAELQRSTKKNPPTHLRYDLIYTGKAEYDASKEEDAKLDHPAGSVFQGLRADIDGTGSARVFIGHATGQTTGLGGHMAARFIPTVERESIDLVDRNVSTWNKELLYVGGFLSRVAYETEMANVRELWLASAEGGKTVDEEIRAWLTSRCLHALKFFTFHASTPSHIVSNLIEASFFASSIGHPFTIMSSVGVKNSEDVRIPNPMFASFLTQLPVLAEEISTGAQAMVASLRGRGSIKDVTFEDVLAELRARPLSEDELIACMRWWISVWTADVRSRPDISQVRQQLVDAALLTRGTGTPNEKIIPLAQIRTFVNMRSMGSILPLDGPFPEHTIPIDISKNLTPADLCMAFAWRELTVLDWVEYIASPTVAAAGVEHNIEESAVWAERVLNTLAKAWPSLSKTHQAEVVEHLGKKSCIPTRNGLKKPEEAYFPNAHVFPDLPVVTMPKGTIVKGNLEKVLEALGVRKHVDLQVIFNRMIKTGEWAIADLIKYLVAVQQTLSQAEMDRLRATSAFPKEKSGEEGQEQTRYRASDLYEPLDVFRKLKLPVIDWGSQTRWRSQSEEAKFMYQTGLRRFPPLPIILKLAADEDETLRSAALQYFLDNLSKYPDYNPSSFNGLDFVPAVRADGTNTMGSPGKVFVDPDAALLGFLTVHASIRDVAIDKLKLQRSPPTSMLLPLLENSPPQDPALARKWFEVLAGRLSDFTPAQLRRLGELLIVPAHAPTSSEKGTSELRMLAPKKCYFKRDTSQSFHSKLFVFVDFGTKGNAFLTACGTKHEPSVEEIVQILLSDPKQFYHLSGGKDNYLVEMRNIAVNRGSLASGTLARMKRSPMLLSIRRVKNNRDDKQEASAEELDEDEWDSQYDLMRPEQVVVVDDANIYQIFGDSIFTAPQEDLLEEFYITLGSRRLTSMIKEDHKTAAEIDGAQKGKELRGLILERLPLFLHEHTHTRPRVQYSWLNSDSNFVVRTFGKLTVTRYLNYGATRLQRSQDASAVSRKGTFGAVELWIAVNTQVDMYEVAIALCKVLFDVPRANDALLFMTILSTDLRALRRRGYNVDRILKKQRAERDAAEQARREQAKEMEKLVSDVSPQMPQHDAPPIAPTTAKPVAEGPVTVPPPQLPPGADSDFTGRRPGSLFADKLQNWGRKLVTGKDQAKGAPSDAGPARSVSPERDALLSPGGSSNHRARSPQHVTPQSNIENNIKWAIAACKEENGNVLQNRQQMSMVKEAEDEGYCDISGRVDDLMFLGTMGDIKVFVTKDIPNRDTVMSTKHNQLARFIHVVRPLRGVYKLSPTSINVFYDLQGPTIAFNRNASLFLNLRYFESWHDELVEKGDLSKAFISWYLTLAHEIAHNLVESHNSEHEFYFSSICEAHMPALTRLLISAP